MKGDCIIEGEKKIIPQITDEDGLHVPSCLFSDLPHSAPGPVTFLVTQCAGSSPAM